TAHLGSWELCAYYAQKAASKPLHVLAKPSRSKLLTAFLDVLRGRMGTHVLWTDKKTLLRDMLEALRRREALGFVMDQKPEGRSGPVVPFFGVATEFVFGPEKLARKIGCPVIAIFCVREGPLTYRLLSETLFGPPRPAGPAGPAGPGVDPACAQSTADGAVTARCAEAIERVIRAYPEQWTWTYKRWRETI
ncbi:MAG: lysophospholipid acyltransferase family protein, partial [Proteobacteria bacterium]|nr:lysophospholipid acyltransferase family protein [Pseudomonadota bacterium]